jgi:hypothetical protein
MSDPKDKDPVKKPDPQPAADAPAATKSSGRVAFDARGNPIWEWQLETGVYSRDVSTQKLKKLDLGDLSIAETASHKRPPGLGEPEQSRKPVLPGGGFNPYDSGGKDVAQEGSNPYDNARSLGRFGAKPTTPPAEPQRKPTDLRKLDQWIKLKKNLDKKPGE